MEYSSEPNGSLCSICKKFAWKESNYSCMCSHVNQPLAISVWGGPFGPSLSVWSIHYTVKLTKISVVSKQKQAEWRGSEQLSSVSL